MHDGELGTKGGSRKTHDEASAVVQTGGHRAGTGVTVAGMAGRSHGQCRIVHVIQSLPSEGLIPAKSSSRLLLDLGQWEQLCRFSAHSSLATTCPFIHSTRIQCKRIREGSVAQWLREHILESE